MTKIELPRDFAKEISIALDFPAEKVTEYFEIGEDKQGWFYAKKKPKVWLDKTQFKTLCTLCRDYGGQYANDKYTFMVPGPYAKKETSPPVPTTLNEPAGSQRERAPEKEPTGVTPQVVSMDTTKPTYITVPVNALLSMPFQSRSTEDPELAELIESIKIYGVLEPILVRPKPGGLNEIVAGERRVRAAKKAGLTEVPVIIKWLTDQEAYEIQLIENIQRKDLADIEKARMLDYMIKKFGYTQEELAEKLGKSKAWLSLHLQMLELEKVYPGKPEIGKLTERQAREILAAPEEKREEILKQIAETGEVPSSREIHRAVHPERVVPCAGCGVATSEAVHLDGKFYCANCAEKMVEEARRGVQPEKPLERGIDSQAAYKQSGSAFPETAPEGSSENVPVEEPKPEKIDIGKFECPVCHQIFNVIHVANNLHRLERVRKA